MHTLDDETLIQQFVNGEVTLAANQNLRVESAFQSTQLLAKRGGLIAAIKKVGDRSVVLLRQKSDYTELIHQILLKCHVIPTGMADQAEFEQYQKSEIPAGYQVNYTEARALWKEWWKNTRQSNPYSIQIELLIFARNTWYPVRNIVCNDSNLFVATLATEVAFQGSERIVWLSRQSAPLPASAARPLTCPAPASLNQSTRALSVASSASVAAVPAAVVPNPSVSRETLDGRAFNPDLRQVLRFRQGKLYITTALGEIVVEGRDLKFWLNEDELAVDGHKPIDLNGYRDREGRAVNH